MVKNGYYENEGFLLASDILCVQNLWLAIFLCVPNLWFENLDLKEIKNLKKLDLKDAIEKSIGWFLVYLFLEVFFF